MRRTDIQKYIEGAEWVLPDISFTRDTVISKIEEVFSDSLKQSMVSSIKAALVNELATLTFGIDRTWAVEDDEPTSDDYTIRCMYEGLDMPSLDLREALIDEAQSVRDNVSDKPAALEHFASYLEGIATEIREL